MIQARPLAVALTWVADPAVAPAELRSFRRESGEGIPGLNRDARRNQPLMLFKTVPVHPGDLRQWRDYGRVTGTQPRHSGEEAG